MDRTADLDSALSFVMGRIAEEAKLTGQPLSEQQRLLLNYLPSSTTTNWHYSAWVKARQERAEADVIASWATDPLIVMERDRSVAHNPDEGDAIGTRERENGQANEKSRDIMAGTTGLGSSPMTESA
jgi:hypothetical protein